MVSLAEAERPLACVLDMGDQRLMPPGGMPERLIAMAAESGQELPNEPGAIARCILDSLALAYRRTINEACELAGRSLDAVHIVGGGSQLATAIGQLSREIGGLFWVGVLVRILVCAMGAFACYLYLAGGIGILQGRADGAEKGAMASTTALTIVGIDLVWSIIFLIALGQRSEAASARIGGAIGAAIFVAVLQSVIPAALLYWCTRHGRNLPR